MSLRKNVLWNTFGSVFYQGCIWLMTVLVVRLSSDYQNSGMLAFAMSVGNIYTAIGTYTMRTYQVSDVTGRYNASNYVALRIVTVLGGLVACGIYSLAISPSSNTMLVIGVFLLFKADEAFANVLYGCDQVAMRLDYVGISQVSQGVICVSFFALGLVATNNLVVALLSVFLGCILVTAFYDIPRTRALVDSLHPSISKRQCLDLLKESFGSPVLWYRLRGGRSWNLRLRRNSMCNHSSLGPKPVYAHARPDCRVLPSWEPALRKSCHVQASCSCRGRGAWSLRAPLLVCGTAAVAHLWEHNHPLCQRATARTARYDRCCCVLRYLRPADSLWASQDDAYGLALSRAFGADHSRGLRDSVRSKDELRRLGCKPPPRPSDTLTRTLRLPPP